MSREYAAVITAGGRIEGAFAQAAGTAIKALARVGERTMLQAAIAAVRAAGIERVAVVGGDEVRAACADDVDRFIPESPSGIENQRLALHAWENGGPLLYLTSDMPFIDAASLAQFLDGVPAGALSLPLTEMRDFERRFPGAPPFGITLAGERVVNGGVFAVPAGACAAVEDLALELFAARKSVWGMARLSGPALLIAFALRRLGVGHLERRAEQLLGVPAHAVRRAPPELAYDVDLFEEYRYAAAHA